MSTVLFVKANSRPAELAVSVKLYDAFLQSYRETHPEDQITELDLFAEALPYYDHVGMNGMYKQAKGLELTAEEADVVALVNRYLDQFLAADKVVFAFPLWNFTIPAQLATYLHYLVQIGKTFSYTAEGPVGLAKGKKVALLNARGGVYSEGPMASFEMSLNYVKNVMAFFGITDPEIVVVEGHNQYPDRTKSIIQEGLKQAAALAARF